MKKRGRAPMREVSSQPSHRDPCSACCVPLNPLGTQPPLRELSVSTTAWLLGVSVKAARRRLDQIKHPDGAPGARRSGGHWVIDAGALRLYIEQQQNEVRLMMLDRVVGRTAVPPAVPKDGPPPPLSAAVLEWS